MKQTFAVFLAMSALGFAVACGPAQPAATPSGGAQPSATTPQAAVPPDDGASIGAPIRKRLEAVTIPQYTGKDAPDLRLALFDGTNFNLDDFKGKPVLINFWASWCGPCRNEMPALERSWQQYKDQIAFVGVAVQDTDKDARAAAARAKVNYPLGLDVDGKLGLDYQVIAMPTTVIVDANGIIVKRFSGEVTEGALNFFIANNLPGVKQP